MSENDYFPALGLHTEYQYKIEEPAIQQRDLIHWCLVGHLVV
jgi:hypothetical protein